MGSRGVRLAELYEAPLAQDGTSPDADALDFERGPDDEDFWSGPDETLRTEEDLVRKGWRPPDDGRSLGGVHWVGRPAAGARLRRLRLAAQATGIVYIGLGSLNVLRAWPPVRSLRWSPTLTRIR